MEPIIRAAIVYVVLLVLFSIAGKRAMSETDTFDFIVLLIVSEAVQNALIGDDLSFTNAILVVITLMGLTIMMSVWKYRSATLEKVLNGGPIVLVHNGEPMQERMRRARVDLPDILKAARSTQGLERLEQIKYAVLEEGGDISIIPAESS